MGRKEIPFGMSGYNRQQQDIMKLDRFILEVPAELQMRRKLRKKRGYYVSSSMTHR